MLQDTSNAGELLYLGCSGLQFDTTFLCKTEHGLLFWPTLVAYIIIFLQYIGPVSPLDHSIQNDSSSKWGAVFSLTVGGFSSLGYQLEYNWLRSQLVKHYSLKCG